MALIYPIASLLFLLAVWQGVVTTLDVKPFILPSPALVLRVILDRYDVLLHHTLITSYETMAGFILSVLIGIPLAAVIVAWRPVERLLYPLLVASQTVPKVAIAPLFIVWLGFGFLPKIIIAFLVAFFPIVISTVAGLE
jgi:NitT/TauT family transport system permease protein